MKQVVLASARRSHEPEPRKKTIMAGRILNRHTPQEEADHANQYEESAEETVAEVVPPKRPRKTKSPAPPKVKKPRKKKAPPRTRARWGVFDAGMKQVAIFDYNQRAAAEEKLADLQSKKKGTHFLQIVKEPMPEPPLVETLVLDENLTP